jgi:hypothetical protein
MPHAFKAHPKHPAVDYLIRLHADLGGRILENKRQAERLAADMKHVEAVLKMFDPTYSVRAISAAGASRETRGSSAAPCSGKPWTCSEAPRPLCRCERLRTLS